MNFSTGRRSNVTNNRQRPSRNPTKQRPNNRKRQNNFTNPKPFKKQRIMNNKSIRIQNRSTSNNNANRNTVNISKSNKIITTALTKRGLRVQLPSNKQFQNGKSNGNRNRNRILAQNRKNKFNQLRFNKKLNQKNQNASKKRPPQYYNRDGYQNGLNSNNNNNTKQSKPKNKNKARRNTKKTGLLQWKSNQNNGQQRDMRIQMNNDNNNQRVSSVVSYAQPQGNNVNNNGHSRMNGNKPMIQVLVPQELVGSLFGAIQPNSTQNGSDVNDNQGTSRSLSQRFDENPYL